MNVAMHVIPPDGLIIHAPDRDAALVALPVARDQVCDPLGLETLVDLDVGIGGIVLNIDGIRGR